SPAFRTRHPPELLVDPLVSLGHVCRGKPPFSGRPAADPINLAEMANRPYHPVLIVADEAGRAILDDLGYAPLAERHHRGAAGERLRHDQTERFGPADRKEHRRCVAEEAVLVAATHLADELDPRLPQQRLDDLLV